MNDLIEKYLDTVEYRNEGQRIAARNIFKDLSEITQKDLLDITYKDLHAYAIYKYINKKWTKASTVKNKFSEIKRFYDYLKKNRLISNSPMKSFKWWRRWKDTSIIDEIDVKYNKDVIEEIYKRIKRIVDSHVVSDRDRAIWYLITSVPIKAKTVGRIKKENVDLERNRITIDDAEKDEAKHILLTDDAKKMIYRHMLKIGTRGEYLFPGGDDKNGEKSGIRYLTVRNIVKRIHELTLPEEVTKTMTTSAHMHFLQEICIKKYIESGADLFSLLYHLGMPDNIKRFKKIFLESRISTIQIGKSHRRYQRYLKRRDML